MKKITLALSLILNIMFAGYVLLDKSKPFYKRVFKTSYKDQSDSLLVSYNNKYKTFNEKQSMFERLPITTSDIVFVGNSLTASFPLAEMLRQPNVINRGIAGNNSYDILPRFKKVCKQNPAKIFLMAGINDIFLDIPEAETFLNIETMLEYVDKSKTELVIQSILPISDVKLTSKVIAYNLRLKSMCAKNKILYIDLFPEFYNGKAIKGNLTTDGTHLTPAGYFLWKQAIVPFLNPSAPKLASL